MHKPKPPRVFACPRNGESLPCDVSTNGEHAHRVEALVHDGQYAPMCDTHRVLMVAR